MPSDNDTEPLLRSPSGPPSYSVAPPGQPSSLTQRKPGRRPRPSWEVLLLAAVALLVCIGVVVQVGVALSRPRDILDPKAREELRREWLSERETHKKEHEQWALERQQHDDDAVRWERERQEIGRERQQWEEELAHAKEQWEEELAHARGRWAKEKARHDEEDRRWEKERWERMRLYWGDIWRNDRCHSYATREYTARLWNIAPGADGIQACMRTAVTINGRELEIASPSNCEDRVRNGTSMWLRFGPLMCS